MGYKHPFVFALETAKFVVGATHHTSVDIAPHALRRLERSNLVGQLNRAEITGVPNLIYVAKELPQRLVEGVVCIRNDSYALH
jgi:hypothetical protein